MTYLGNFARTGNPNGAGSTYWQRYDASRRDVLHLSYPIAAHYDAFTAHHCEFWYDAPPSEGLF
jgi:para-nitrobenzyl esterase